MLLCATLLASAPAPAAGLALPAETSLLQSASDVPRFAQDGVASKRLKLAFLTGYRWFRDDLYGELGDELGLETTFDYQFPESAFGLEIGTSFSFQNVDFTDTDFYSTTFEIYGGARATALLADGHLRPYVAAGPSLTFLGFAADSNELDFFGDESTFGFYARAGVTWVFDNGFCIGLDYRELFGTGVELLDEDAEIDFGQLGLTLGVAL